ncbi:ABC transporter ATP-binding protein [Acuticoccus yangtzensis]|uniref:ABC transporter ATP-binding protein n=1 Tax=Acuticoccus yangtzensis TaxID=1443441 RepID=UPI0009496E4C|nr:ABC transporter ATP-binding protein [Acuticoccus yangtzensis]
MSSLSLQALTKRFGETPVVDGATLDVAEGEFVSLLGPSGCGKTTILRMVAGLLAPTSGTIMIGPRDVTRVATHKRRIGLVFQSYALFPHLTVFDNVAFGLKRQGVKDVAPRVAEALAMVQLGHLGARFPKELSGGQQQRIALARALAPRPSLLLLDEPLSNLDAQLRDDMQIQLKRLQRDLGITSLFVTHDQSEALSLSDRICILAHGKIQQYASPEEVYRRPANGFVARFIGKPNALTGSLSGDRVDIGVPLAFAPTVALPASGPVEVVVRHSDVALSRTPVTAPNAFAATVRLRSFVGARIQYVVGIEGGPEIIAEVDANEPAGALNVGDSVTAVIDPAAVYVSPAPAGASGGTTGQAAA